MDEGLVRTFVIGFCVFVSLLGGCQCIQNYQDDEAMSSMVITGADPIDARCAIKGAANSAECIVRAATKNK